MAQRQTGGVRSQVAFQRIGGALQHKKAPLTCQRERLMSQASLPDSGLTDKKHGATVPTCRLYKLCRQPVHLSASAYERRL